MSYKETIKKESALLYCIKNDCNGTAFEVYTTTSGPLIECLKCGAQFMMETILKLEFIEVEKGNFIPNKTAETYKGEKEV